MIVPVVVAVLPIFEWTDGYLWLGIHRRLARLSEENRLGFVDWRDVLTAEPQDSVTLDAWHPNPRGHRIIAETLADWVRSNAPPAERPAAATGG